MATMGGGFARHASGLLVPEEHKREREPWSYDDWKVIDRATRFLESRGVRLYLSCPEPGCEAPMERLRSVDGGITLRCAHRDRIVVRYRNG